MKKYNDETEKGNLFCYEIIDDGDSTFLPKHKQQQNMPFFNQIKQAARNKFFRDVEEKKEG